VIANSINSNSTCAEQTNKSRNPKQVVFENVRGALRNINFFWLSSFVYFC